MGGDARADRAIAAARPTLAKIERSWTRRYRRSKGIGGERNAATTARQPASQRPAPPLPSLLPPRPRASRQ